MGLRFRKRIRLTKHLGINVGLRGIGISARIPGASAGISTRGLRASVGVPGTGLSYGAEKQWTRRRRATDAEGMPARSSRLGAGLVWGAVIGAVILLHAVM